MTAPVARPAAPATPTPAVWFAEPCASGADDWPMPPEPQEPPDPVLDGSGVETVSLAAAVRGLL